MAYPPKMAKGEEIEITQAWIDHQAKDEKRVRMHQYDGECGMRRPKGNWRS